MTSQAEQQPLIPTGGPSDAAPKAFPVIPAVVTGVCALLGCVLSVLLLLLPWATFAGKGSMSLLFFTFPEGKFAGQTASAGDLQDYRADVLKKWNQERHSLSPSDGPPLTMVDLFYVWEAPLGRICFLCVVACVAASGLALAFLAWALYNARKAVASGDREKVLKACKTFGNIFSLLQAPLLVTPPIAFICFLIVVLGFSALDGQSPRSDAISSTSDRKIFYPWLGAETWHIDIDGTGGFVMLVLLGMICILTYTASAALTKRIKALFPAPATTVVVQPQYCAVPQRCRPALYGPAPGMQPQYAMPPGMQPQYGAAPGMRHQYAPAAAMHHYGAAPGMQPPYVQSGPMQPPYGAAPGVQSQHGAAPGVQPQHGAAPVEWAQ